MTCRNQPLPSNFLFMAFTSLLNWILHLAVIWPEKYSLNSTGHWKIRPLPLCDGTLTDGTFLMLGSKFYYRWDLYYTWVQLLHLFLLQTPRFLHIPLKTRLVALKSIHFDSTTQQQQTKYKGKEVYFGMVWRGPTLQSSLQAHSWSEIT